MSMRVYYLDCHEAGLCCYLVIHIENNITSITAILLPFVAYLLTVPRTVYSVHRVYCLFHMVLTINSDCFPEQH
jgi:hypothetical protein